MLDPQTSGFRDSAGFWDSASREPKNVRRKARKPGHEAPEAVIAGRGLT